MVMVMDLDAQSARARLQPPLLDDLSTTLELLVEIGFGQFVATELSRNDHRVKTLLITRSVLLVDQVQNGLPLGSINVGLNLASLNNPFDCLVQ